MNTPKVEAFYWATIIFSQTLGTALGYWVVANDHDTKGAASIEFALTALPFMLIVFGLLQCGLWIWTQFALQHATEMATRCASINTTLCGTTGAIQNYAAQQALGLNVQASIFRCLKYLAATKSPPTIFFHLLHHRSDSLVSH